MGEPLAWRVGRTLRRRWRAWLRGVHRDVGYLVVGLTFVYAISGLLVNHIGGAVGDVNQVARKETHQIDASAVPRQSDEAAARAVVAALDREGEPREPFLAEGVLDFKLGERMMVVDLERGVVTEEWEEPRPFVVRVANWLHLNRGKEAWTYFADGYAILLLFLATSGIFMLKGRKGFFGRGAFFITVGVLVPILYVHYSGGPGG